jgi:hypothetical protein
VLLLVLDDHAEREAALLEPPAFQRTAFEDVEHLVADLADVRAGLGRRQQRQLGPVGTRMLERVVQVVDVVTDRLTAADVADQPQLLLVADVGEVPDQR